jgi:pimeloyl-ACP methyl ester carboxylesterase
MPKPLAGTPVAQLTTSAMSSAVTSAADCRLPLEVPSLSSELIEGVGHLLMLEKPAEINGRILQFLGKA